jgi:hypothetical protein
MQHISITVPNGKRNNLSSIVGAYKILTRANEYWRNSGKKQPYVIELAGLSKKVEYYDGLFSVKPHKHISEIHKTNLVIIPSLNHDYVQSVKQNKPLIE